MKRRQVAKPVGTEISMDLQPEGLLIALPADSGSGRVEVLLRAYSSESRERLALPKRLSEQPLVLARLVQDGAEALEALLPEQPPWRKAAAAPGPAAACSCGDAECSHVPQAMAAGDAAWAADAGLRLALVGWAPEALADAALARWAAAQPLPEPEEALRAYAGGPDAPPRSPRGEGPHLAEWLAEMAGQGRLHLPGPRFHDVAAGLEEELRDGAPSNPASAAEPRPSSEPGLDAAPWAALLPGVSGAAKGLELVAARVMERAAELAAGSNRGSRSGKIR